MNHRFCHNEAVNGADYADADDDDDDDIDEEEEDRGGWKRSADGEFRQGHLPTCLQMRLSQTYFLF
eukprot:CAMPEP_0184025144 /NCGR_PEP_ID=MMETSP0954-20121128/12589_1 /TAXON_ID=627963 /ORGANISM="Aplanochytrium sp, Strain PBS07" /LENGTH=65 /DNA_ID=CAMNT_0026308779 /DNA_START=369 /DNA_END=566 /DNA_ORIENTATION=-